MVRMSILGLGISARFSLLVDTYTQHAISYMCVDTLCISVVL